MALHIVSQIYVAVPTVSEYRVISHLDLKNLGILHLMSCITQPYESDMYRHRYLSCQCKCIRVWVKYTDKMCLVKHQDFSPVFIWFHNQNKIFLFPLPDSLSIIFVEYPRSAKIQGGEQERG